MSKSKGNKTEKKWYAVLGGFVVIALAIAYIIVSSLCGSWNPLEWIKKDAPDTEPPDAPIVAVSETGEAMYAGNTYAMPRAMTVTQDTTFSPTGEITLTAKLTNEYVNASFEWSAEWANAKSEWATDKNITDFCEMAAATDGSGGITFKVKAPFGEQIVILAKLVGTESDGKCTVDYLKRITLNEPSFYGGFCDACSLEGELSYGIGTVKGDTISLTYAYLAFDDNFKNKVNSLLKFDVVWKAYLFDINVVQSISKDNFSCFDFFGILDMSMFIADYENLSDEQKYAIHYAWDKAYNGMQYPKNNALLDFDFVYSYSGFDLTGNYESDMVCEILVSDNSTGY